MDRNFEDEEIDLKELFVYLWKKKILIGGITGFFSLLTIIYSLMVTPLWDVYGTLRETSVENQMQLPSSLNAAASMFGVNLGGQATNTNLPFLQSRGLAEEFILNNNILPILFEDEENENIDFSDVQVIYGAVTTFTEEVLSVSSDIDTGLITVVMRWKDPFIAYDWNIKFVELANRLIKDQDLILAENFYSYLNTELNATSSVELRQTIAAMIESQMQTIMLANADTEYAFSYIDPPRIPDRRAYPRRSVMVLLAFFASLLISIIVVLITKPKK